VQVALCGYLVPMQCLHSAYAGAMPTQTQCLRSAYAYGMGG
jgi:hypothetical protein